jgi:hypothetical protein
MARCMRRSLTSRFSPAFLVGMMLAGCSSSATPPPMVTDGGIDGPAGGGTLTGVVRDKAGVAVTGAKVEVGGASIYSDSTGKYTLAGLPAGAATLKVTRDWFKPLDASVTVNGMTSYDITVEEMPLTLEAADRALAEGYAKTFDWTKDKISIAVVSQPTRRDFDNAVYLHNPALFRDTSTVPPLVPQPTPDIAGTTASNFTFPIRSGARMGQEALDPATVADAIAGTPLGPQEPAEYMVWTPMVNWLSEWDAAKAAELKAVGLAVRQQSWGGNAQRPQEIEKVYLDAQNALWVKVVFAPFVQLGPGVKDDDGDGQKEIYAKVASASYGPEVIEQLTTNYAKTVFNTHGLSKELSKSLNELYSTTAAQVERFIGQPFEVPGVGTIAYPFVVLKHSGGQKNVLLVAPGP